MSTAADFRVPRNLLVFPRRDLSLDFANTLMWRGSTPAETLHNPRELLTWIGSVGALPERAVSDLSKWFEAHSTQAATIFGAAIEIREIIYRLLRSTASESPPGREDLRRLNSALDAAAPRTILDLADSGFGWQVDAKPTVAGILTAVLWSAADILVSGEVKRLRQCANDRCLWLFFDDSKNGTRRWCSMQACGNRAKAHRHYLRQKGQ